MLRMKSPSRMKGKQLKENNKKSKNTYVGHRIPEEEIRTKAIINDISRRNFLAQNNIPRSYKLIKSN